MANPYRNSTIFRVGEIKVKDFNSFIADPNTISFTITELNEGVEKLTEKLWRKIEDQFQLYNDEICFLYFKDKNKILNISKSQGPKGLYFLLLGEKKPE